PGHRPRRAAARLLRVDAARQLRVDLGLQPAFRRGPRRPRDAGPHAEGLRALPRPRRAGECGARVMSAEANTPRVAVVTGAASGVGRATCAGLEDDGYAVVGLDLAEAPAKHAAWVRGDVSAQETWDRAVAEVDALDPAGATALVSAAADIVVAPFLQTSPDDYRRLF